MDGPPWSSGPGPHGPGKMTKNGYHFGTDFDELYFHIFDENHSNVIASADTDILV